MSHHDETKPSVQHPRVDDEDVEGHAMSRAAAEPDGVASRRIDDDDVEGHSASARRATEPDGVSSRRLDDDDVEGHGKARAAGDDDDVEGHYGQLKSPASRGE